MWRMVLAIVAIVFNALILIFVLLGGLGVTIILSRGQPLSQSLILGLGFFALAGVTSIISIVAILVGRHAKPPPRDVAGAFI